MHVVTFSGNKAVVGSSRGDVPKYKGEGVALHDLPDESGRSKMGEFERNHEFWLKCALMHPKHAGLPHCHQCHILQYYITTWNVLMMSQVTSPHMHAPYKRVAVS